MNSVQKVPWHIVNCEVRTLWMFSCVFLPRNSLKKPSKQSATKSMKKNKHQGPVDGGGFRPGVSRFGLVRPDLSFLGLSRFFRDFPDLFGDFPICRFPSSWPVRRTYKEHFRNGQRHNQELSRKKWEPSVWVTRS